MKFTLLMMTAMCLDARSSGGGLDSPKEGACAGRQAR